jgi:hypothetical protein
VNEASYTGNSDGEPSASGDGKNDGYEALLRRNNLKKIILKLFARGVLICGLTSEIQDGTFLFHVERQRRRAAQGRASTSQLVSVKLTTGMASVVRASASTVSQQSLTEQEALVPGGSRPGNIRSRPNPGKHWFFTWNNYPEDYERRIGSIGSNGSIVSVVVQSEVGENGTPHLQGYIAFKTKGRPMGLLPKEVYWERARDPGASIEYCRKDETHDGKFRFEKGVPRKLIDPMEGLTLKWWQTEILEEIKKPADRRTIRWYWEPVGGVGKTVFACHLVDKYKALFISGKAADVKYAVAERVKAGEPVDVVVVNIPRSHAPEYISYEGMENVKDGLFFSTKYESGMVRYNPPHVIVFANVPPDVTKMSADRWVIKEIGPEADFAVRSGARRVPLTDEDRVSAAIAETPEDTGMAEFAGIDDLLRDINEYDFDEV